jgi:hypothetical protein
MYAYRTITILLSVLYISVYAQAQIVPDSISHATHDSSSTAIGKHITHDTANVLSDTLAALSPDTTKKSILVVDSVKKHTAQKAVWRSAVLPGWGQAYNRKYWKLPIVYAGLGGLGYLVYFEATQYKEARTSYRAAVRDPSNNAVYQGHTLDANTIKAYRDYYLKNLNLSAIGLVIWYCLNLVDAAVDGHLYHYNMDDKLSFNVDPSFHISSGFSADPTCLGLSLTVIPIGRKH